MYKLSMINNKRLPFLQCIANGSKKAECRIASDYIRSFKVGGGLLLYSGREFTVCEITFLHFYKSFEDMLSAEGVENMVPFAKSFEGALEIYKSFPGAKRVESQGCVAIGVKCIRSKLKFTI